MMEKFLDFPVSLLSVSVLELLRQSRDIGGLVQLKLTQHGETEVPFAIAVAFTGEPEEVQELIDLLNQFGEED